MSGTKKRIKIWPLFKNIMGRPFDIMQWCDFAQLTSNHIRSHNYFEENRIIRKKMQNGLNGVHRTLTLHVSEFLLKNPSK